MESDEAQGTAPAAAAADVSTTVDPVGAPPAVVPSTSPSTDASASASPAMAAEARLHALETKTAMWKEAVATQLNDASRKNKKLREELRAVREEMDAALGDLRVQLTDEFHERTAMQREELAALTTQAALLREEKKAMAAAHEAELQRARVQLRELIQLEVETNYKRKDEQWSKEMTALQTRAEAKETEKVQAEHECEVLKMRLNRLGAQYEELASLLQPKGGEGSSAPSQASDGLDEAAGLHIQGPARQQTAVNAAFTQQLESMKAELQSKEQHTQFVLDRAKQEHEAEKSQLLRELQLREEELKVAHTLLKQVQVESSGYQQRVSHAQTEKQALEQRYAAKVAALNAKLAERVQVVEEAQVVTKRLQEQLRTAQQQVATLEEESIMREEAFHSLMLSEDDKRVVMELQRAVQTARDEAEAWKMQYYTALSSPPNGAKTATGDRGGTPSAIQEGGRSSGGRDGGEAALSTAASPAVETNHNNRDGASPHAVPAAAVRTPQAWHEQLAAKEASLEAHAAQLERKAHLLDAAEAKLNDMRRSLASQASILLQQQKGGRRERNSDNGVVFREGKDGGGLVEESEHEMLGASPIISTAASLLPSTWHGSLRALETQRRRLHLPGSCRCMFCFFSGGGNSGAPLRLRRDPFVFTLIVILFVMLIIVVSAM
ncbi:hypothetical protein ABB37_07321 [Leptomonas pyrrhocoris]|uniref:Uncharacterized protein n=1 Tax=Leptomonas pyrrhocoris TaxID=157538 RepID=A0A0M9FVI9_LEPPY|nr:hypothetical protein ABB37_07321 [Leptomonas pyrrhocoris]XP_015655384.1 hypothetical protein ABB37_07321 [Leptomonas pyrrhocoris]KPA76944.1 hypothetical protein ABB37_07321 [Leptomonas pyrrhocoris]KPA76945.1 hypothetical protein ABB37_07321 [Leptomonas pyrrhocoris]|eukprot:XP_015655383.1 hypothetical protein ABB37_07321 [Leptomonas pyrrhocoris]